MDDYPGGPPTWVVPYPFRVSIMSLQSDSAIRVFTATRGISQVFKDLTNNLIRKVSQNRFQIGY